MSQTCLLSYYYGSRYALHTYVTKFSQQQPYSTVPHFKSEIQRSQQLHSVLASWEGPRFAFLGTLENMESKDGWWREGVFLGGRLSPETRALPRPRAACLTAGLLELSRLEVTTGFFWLDVNLLSPSRMPEVGVEGKVVDSWLLIEMTSPWLSTVSISWPSFSISWLLIHITSLLQLIWLDLRFPWLSWILDCEKCNESASME